MVLFQETPGALLFPAGLVTQHTPTTLTDHTFRHSFANHLLAGAYDIRTVQELLGDRDVKTTMVYTRVLNQGPSGSRNPLEVV
jgi:site-specific recombinase XerD